MPDKALLMVIQDTHDIVVRPVTVEGSLVHDEGTGAAYAMVGRPLRHYIAKKNGTLTTPKREKRLVGIATEEVIPLVAPEPVSMLDVRRVVAPIVLERHDTTTGGESLQQQEREERNARALNMASVAFVAIAVAVSIYLVLTVVTTIGIPFVDLPASWTGGEIPATPTPDVEELP